MRLLLVILMPLALLGGCKTAYFPFVVNNTGNEITLELAFSDNQDREWVLPAGKGAWVGRKDASVTRIILSQNQKIKTLDQSDLHKIGYARTYVIRGLADVQVIK